MDEIHKYNAKKKKLDIQRGITGYLGDVMPGKGS